MELDTTMKMADAVSILTYTRIIPMVSREKLWAKAFDGITFTDTFYRNNYH